MLQESAWRVFTGSERQEQQIPRRLLGPGDGSGSGDWSETEERQERRLDWAVSLGDFLLPRSVRRDESEESDPTKIL